MQIRKDSSTRATLDRLNRELGARVHHLSSIPERVVQDQFIFVGGQLYLGVERVWEPIGLRVEQPWSAEIPAADE